MNYTVNGVLFNFYDGTVTISHEDKEIMTKEIGFDTSEGDFIKWCDYFVESKEFKTFMLTGDDTTSLELFDVSKFAIYYKGDPNPFDWTLCKIILHREQPEVVIESKISSAVVYMNLDKIELYEKVKEKESV